MVLKPEPNSVRTGTGVRLGVNLLKFGQKTKITADNLSRYYLARYSRQNIAGIGGHDEITVGPSG